MTFVPLARVPVSSLWIDWISLTSPSRQRLGQPAILLPRPASSVPRLPRKDLRPGGGLRKQPTSLPPGRSGVPSQRNIDSLYRLDIYSALDPFMTNKNCGLCFISLFSSAGINRLSVAFPKYGTIPDSCSVPLYSVMGPVSGHISSSKPGAPLVSPSLDVHRLVP